MFSNIRIHSRLEIAACVIYLVCGTVASAAAAPWSVRTQPVRPVNGGPVLFQVKGPSRLKSLTATWLGHQLTFSYSTTSKTWFALGGASLETTPDKYPLVLNGVTDAGPALTVTRQIPVTRAKYPKIKVALTVEKKFTEPSNEQLEQIAEAKKIKSDYLNRVTPEREWSGKFASPANAEISDVFGSQRIFNNGQAQSPHQGLDFRVPTGTSVTAMNDGTVLLARPLFYEGNFVVIDHGQGLLTLYLHLSEFKVKEGDAVKRGQEIGLSGGTGRATGPHLHVAVRWQGTYLDPARLLQLPLP
jgi:murein DD-endopeptidase MepM/ murein hydrolase activator NlpD